MTAILPVILAGGAGTRLWPVSRETMPKHLAKIIGDQSLLQLTARRVMAEAAPDGLITVAAQHRLLEPVGRNTAAAIALAGLHAQKHVGGDALLWVCPSDHLIRDEAALSDALKHALPAAARGDLLTFGPASDNSAVCPVERFVEKPDLETAKAMLAEGGYLWNSGMFLFRADRIIEELGTHEPAILAATEAAYRASSTTEDGSLHPPKEHYENVPSMPIDKAVMERASRISVVPCNPGWTDLGSWQAIWEESEKDEDGNAAGGDVLLHDAKNCLIRGKGRLVALAGVQDLAVIETDDAVLVVDRARSEPVKQLVADLNAAGRSETLRHLAVDHTWGQAVLLEKGCDAEVQRLEIVPGKAVEAAAGVDRDLHWLVMSGHAEIERSGERQQLASGQSADLPAGTAYRLENNGAAPLQLLQVSQHR